MKKDVDLVPSAAMRRLRQELETHAVFNQIVHVKALQTFMQVHVFAIWDFMSLIKRLQRDLTCVELPWMPPSDPVAARLINDIVLAEESDVDAEGHPASHLDLYLSAMRDVGASTAQLEHFMREMRGGTPFPEALAAARVPQFVRDFVEHTIGTCAYGSTLQRHIQLDDDHHGPAASRMIDVELARKANGLQDARQAALQALLARRALWDGAAALLRACYAPGPRRIPVRSNPAAVLLQPRLHVL
jgi:hypothetical protein